MEMIHFPFGMPLETCSAFNKLWNNKFYYKLHLVGISTESYYDAWIHEYQIYKRTWMPLLRFRGFGRFLLVSVTLLLFDRPFRVCTGWGKEDVATILGTVIRGGIQCVLCGGDTVCGAS